jgi:hypothetical protein
MRTLTFRAMLSWLLILVFPASLFAADSSAAMLYTNGTAWINGGTVPKSQAIFSGDLVQTRTDSVANIKQAGTSVLVFSDSLVQYQGGSVKLEHGSVNVGTSKSMATEVGALKIVPASESTWTEFEVHDTDGSVKIIARKGDLKLIDENGTTILPQDQEKTVEEGNHKHKRDRGAGGAVPAAGGGILNSPVAIGVGIGVIGGVAAWALIHDDDPLSPKRP